MRRNVPQQRVLFLIMAGVLFFAATAAAETAVPQAGPSFSRPPNQSLHFKFQQTSGFEHSFTTGFADIYYPDEETLRAFLWRISGKKFTLRDDTALAAERVDRILTRVQSVLDLFPEGLRLTIKLMPRYTSGKIASYEHGSRTILIYTDKVTDGIFAHETAHAVLSASFAAPPPHKMQEILAQYVDRHLWDDYDMYF